MGTQVLYDSGYDPRAWRSFLKSSKRRQKGRIRRSFSPTIRIRTIALSALIEEIEKLGGLPPNARRDSTEFESIKREVLALPVVKKADAGSRGGGGIASPRLHLRIMSTYQATGYSLKYPDNWKKYREAKEAMFPSLRMAGCATTAAATERWHMGFRSGAQKVQGDPSAPNALERRRSN